MYKFNSSTLPTILRTRFLKKTFQKLFYWGFQFCARSNGNKKKKRMGFGFIKRANRAMCKRQPLPSYYDTCDVPHTTHICTQKMVQFLFYFVLVLLNNHFCLFVWTFLKVELFVVSRCLSFSVKHFYQYFLSCFLNFKHFRTFLAFGLSCYSQAHGNFVGP